MQSTYTHVHEFIFDIKHNKIGKFFYNRLVTFMTSGEIGVHILARHDAITRWRQLMGPTKVYRYDISGLRGGRDTGGNWDSKSKTKALCILSHRTRLEHPDTIRGRFGASDTRNATHGSDSVESATREIGFFFPEFSIKQWYEVEEPAYRRALELVQLDRDKQVVASAENGLAAIKFDEQTLQHRILWQT